MPAVFSTALQRIFITTYKRQKGLGSAQSSFQALQCLALHFLRPPLLHWTSPWAATSKGRKSSRQQSPGLILGLMHRWQLHPVAGIFYICQISLVHFFKPPALCNIREVMKGQENVPKSCGSEEFRVSQMEEEFL